MSLPVLVSAPLNAERQHRQHPCPEHNTPRCRTDNKHGVSKRRRLWRQMLVGFVGAACLGLIMLILGSVFIGSAVKGNTSITVMLCVLGMVCGLIILVGTAILGRMMLSRKLRTGDDDDPQALQHRPEACLHACSIIYTPSQDQLNGPPFQDPPPAYEMVIFPRYHERGASVDSDASVVGEIHEGPTTIMHPVLISPPKYSIAAAPLPKYGDPV